MPSIKTTGVPIIASSLLIALFALFTACASAAENAKAPLDAGTQLETDAKKKGYDDGFMKVVREFLHGEVRIATDQTLTVPELLDFLVQDQKDFATPQVATDTGLKSVKVTKGKYLRVELMNLLLQANPGKFGFDPRRGIEFIPSTPPPPPKEK